MNKNCYVGDSMKLVFLSNYYNHHQSALSEAFSIIDDVEYYFIETQPMDQERKELGWINDIKPNYVKATYISSESERNCIRLIDMADVVIVGSAPLKYVLPRLKANKLTFRYSERVFKNGITPKLLFFLWRDHLRYKKYQQYMLCASAYTACDVVPFGLYKAGRFKWGYFPEVKEIDIDYLLTNKGINECPVILWCGRFINWKHPEMPIKVADYLNKHNYSFKMELIGNGPLLTDIKKMVEEKKLNDQVSLLGSMSPEKVRDHMEQSDIFIATSDYNEGWGAVINEAMNSGCAVIASHAMGSVPFLIENKINGYIFKSGDFQQLISYVVELLEDNKKRIEFGKAAYMTLINTWNAKVASKRFVEISNKILDGVTDVFEDYLDGPCSRSLQIKQKDMYKTIK